MRFNILALVICLSAGCLAAQPVILSQPTNQVVLNGGNVVLGATVSGAGPLTCQWQFNGTNLINNVITTIAGTGTNGFSGDGGPALGAMLHNPGGVALDAGGNVFFIDAVNHRVRRVDTNGIITTVAGNGTYGYSGDGGPATNAMLAAAYGIAVDTCGNLYITDYDNSRIRKVDTNGAINTVVASSSGISQPRGLAVDGGGNLFVTDAGNYRVHKVDTNGIVTLVAGKNSTSYGGDGGLATNATLNPYSVTVDTNGNLYIADYGNNRVRRIDAVSGIITTVAGTNTSGFSGDSGLAVNAKLFWPTAVYADGLGNLLIWDAGNGRIRQIDANGIITTVAGKGSSTYSGDGGPATNAGIGMGGMTSDAFGNLLIADDSGGRIRKVATSKVPYLALNAVTTNNAGTYDVIIANASGSVTSSVVTVSVVFPPAFTAATADVFVTNGSLATLTASVSGTAPFGYQWYAYPATGLAGATNATLTYAAAATNQNGYYYCVVTNAYGSVTSRMAALTVVVPPGIAVQPSNQVVVAGQTAVLSVVPSGTGPFSYQWQLSGTNLPHSNGGTNKPSYNPNIITTIAGAGGVGFIGDGGPATQSALFYPCDVAVGGGGNVLIADQYNNRIRQVDTNGIIRTVAGIGSSGGIGSYSGDGSAATSAGINLPTGLATDPAGNYYIADSWNNRIRKVDTNGMISTVAGTNGRAYSGDGSLAVNANLNYPANIALDTLGNLFIADASNNCIRKVDGSGIITTVVGTGVAGYSGDGGLAVSAKLSAPTGVALDGQGNLFVADLGNNRIRLVNPAGVISTLAGNGLATFQGDGGAAINASLNQPDDILADGFGQVYFSDSANSRIRLIGANGIITTVAGNGAGSYSGDFGTATNASLNQPSGLSFDNSGNLMVADRNNKRIRKIDFWRNPSYTFGNIGAAAAGNYSVIVTSPYGSVTSSIVAMTVVFAPSITAQPASMMVTNGGQAAFSLAAAGTGPLGYQWYFNTNPVLTGGNGTSLVIDPVGNGQTGTYFCVITNAYGSITSRVVRLAIGLPPVITSSSTNLIAYGGGKVSLGVVVAGTGPFSYQWQLNGTNLPNNIITTVAGNGVQAYSGDGGPATNAGVLRPSFIDVDAGGALYIADWSSRIRKVDTNGIISTVAGNGAVQYSGDGVAATASAIGYPSGVEADGYGKLFVGDTYNYRVREVDATGYIHTAVGTGIQIVTFGDGSAATNAGIHSPYGLIMDSVGNLFISDPGNHRIRRVGPDGIIQTVAGVGPNWPFGGGYSGDGGAATNASLNMPYGLALDNAGNLYIADNYSHVVRKIDGNGIITTIAGNGVKGFAGDGGAATNASFSFPRDVKVDLTGNVYISDSGNNRIRRVDTNGIISTVAGTGTNAYAGDGGPATNADLNNPTGMALDLAGNLFVADYSNNCVRVISLAGTPVLTLSPVNPASAGNYSVVVSNPYGSVTNSVANLGVILLPQNFSVTVGSGNAVQLQFGGTPDHTYVLQTATNLAPPVNWLPVITNAATAGGNWVFTDTNTMPATQRFYRALP